MNAIRRAGGIRGGSHIRGLLAAALPRPACTVRLLVRHSHIKRPCAPRSGVANQAVVSPLLARLGGDKLLLPTSCRVVPEPFGVGTAVWMRSIAHGGVGPRSDGSPGAAEAIAAARTRASAAGQVLRDAISSREELLSVLNQTLAHRTRRLAAIAVSILLGITGDAQVLQVCVRSQDLKLGWSPVRPRFVHF